MQRDALSCEHIFNMAKQEFLLSSLMIHSFILGIYTRDKVTYVMMMSLYYLSLHSHCACLTDVVVMIFLLDIYSTVSAPEEL
jgi:hypothetical protein